jgi:hypothetical protein
VDRDVTKERASRVENKVFTFGGGWYGRLGLGPEEKANVYSPREVRFIDAGAMFTVEVGCGAYHTVSLNRSGELYAWGKKDMVCEVNDNLFQPRKFMHIEASVKAVVCGELHTCALTAKGELWFWGKNESGQFGVGDRVDKPKSCVQVNSADLPGACKIVATGTAHTLMVFGAGEILACGNQGCGRLGLEPKKQNQKFVLKPEPVQAEWASIQSMSAVAGEKKEAPRTLDDMFGDTGRKEDEGKAPQNSEEHTSSMLRVLESGQKVTTFGTMQALIKQEQEGSRPKQLKETEDKLQKDLSAKVEDIKALVAQEKGLKELENDLQQALESNMKFFGKAITSPDTGNLRVSQEVVQRLPKYEELIWVLQQQVYYLAKLSGVVRENEEHRTVFYSIVAGIFREADTDQRTRHLFLMCMRLMFMDEVDAVNRVQIGNVFDKDKSRAFVVFSKYALSNVHWKDVLHRYLRVADDKAGKKGADETPWMKESLLQKFKIVSQERLECFAIGVEDLKLVYQECGEPPKGQQELLAAYNVTVDSFREFLTTMFLDSVTQVTLPIDMRLLLNYIHTDIMARQPGKDGKVDPEIPPELRLYEPLLYLFVHAILIPVIRDAKEYASKKCLLGASAILFEDAATCANMKRTYQFLERMVADDLKGKDLKILEAASKKVKVRLLEYLRDQVDIANDMEAQILVETYATHFDRKRYLVFLNIADVLKLSNMLKNYESVLRMSEADKMADLLSGIPKWSPQEIKQAEERGVSCMVNFTMNHRFLLNCTEVVKICPRSAVPVPASMAPSGAVPGFFKSYQLDNHKDARRELESLFLELDQLTSTTFPEMKVEFEERRQGYRSGASPNYELMQRLQDGLNIVEELENVEAYPDDVLHFMSSRLISRDRHFQYLKIIQKEIGKMDTTRKEYEKSIAKWKKELELAVDKAREFSLPAQFIAHAPTGTRLKFDELQKQKDKRLFAPEAAKGLNLAYTPIQVYPLKKLEKRGVITDIFKPFQDREMRKSMQVTVRLTPEEPGGGVNMVIDICKKQNKTAIKTLQVPEWRITDMKTADKGAKVQIGNDGEDPFMMVDCAEFVKLTTELAQSTG